MQRLVESKICKKFYRENDSFDRAGSVNDHVFLSQDRSSNAGQKQFYHFALNDWDKVWSVLVSQNNWLYETLPPDQPVKPYFDLEMEGETMDVIAHEKLELFLSFVTSELRRLQGIEIERDDIAVLNSTRLGKLSFHVMIMEKVYFRNVAAHKTFVEYLWSRFENPQSDEEKGLVDSLTWYQGEKKKKKFIFDECVYTNKRHIRLVNQTKKGKPYQLKNESTKYKDAETFCRLYFGVGDRQEFCVDDLVVTNETKKRKHTDKEGNEQEVAPTKHPRTEVECGFNSVGITLMAKEGKTYSSLYDYPEWKRYLYLIPNTCQSYQFYLHMAFAVKGAGGLKKDFDAWAKLYSSNYDCNDSVLKGFDGFQQGGEKCFGIPFLRRHARLAHPAFFNDKEYWLDRYFTTDYSGVRTIVEDSPFVSMEGTPFENDIFCPEPVIILQAFLGRGKTTAIKRLLKKENKDARVLYLSPRISFARFLVKEFGAKLYLDEPGNYASHKQFIISMESLWKLEHDVNLTEPLQYDIIIIDESEANLSAFTSCHMKNQLLTYHVLENLLKNAKKVIIAGAFITNKTMVMARAIGKPICRIQNTTPPQRRTAYEIHSDDFNDSLLSAVKKDEKLFVYFCSRRKMEDFSDAMKKELPEKWQQSLFYSRNGDDSQLAKTLTEIESSWGAAQLVATSPTITVGNSYAPKTPDFNEVWMYLYPSCIAADAFQGHMRVRQVTNNTVRFCLKTGISDSETEIKFRMMEELSEYSDKMTERLRELVRRLDPNEKNSWLLDILCSHEKIPEALVQIIYYNLQEEQISKKFYPDMVDRFFKLCNYEVHYLEQTEGKIEKKKKRNDEEEEGEQGEAISVEDALKQFKRKYRPECAYDQIERETDEESFNRLKSKVETKRGTLEEKNKLLKTLFLCESGEISLVASSLPIEFQREYFELYTDPYREGILWNSILESRGEDGLLDCIDAIEKQKNVHGQSFLITGKSKSLQLEKILELNRRLGISHSMEETEIPRAKIEGVMDFVHGERRLLHETFGLRDKHEEANKDVKTTVALLSKIYSSWSGGGFVSKEKGKKRSATSFLKQPLYCSDPLVKKLKVPLPPFRLNSKSCRM